MPSTQVMPYSHIDTHTAARFLGWFSIGLGLADIVAPRTIKRHTGLPGPAGLLQTFGLREIISGIAILKSETPAQMVWGRVAGDLMDLAAFAPAASRSNPQRTGGLAALGFVALATALDVYVAMQADKQAADGLAEPEPHEWTPQDMAEAMPS